MAQGLLIVVSAPSGAGKQTVLNRVRDLEKNVVTTISATTRAPRTGERDGVDYYFLDSDAFRTHIDAGDFVEWAEVHGHFYGTLKSELDRCLGLGQDVILELDVQGRRSVAQARDDVVSVFLMPPSLEELGARLRSRGTETDEVIAVRLRNAADEIAARHEFDYVIVNDKLENAVEEFVSILRDLRSRPDTQRP